MNTVYVTQNTSLISKLESIIREYSLKDSGKHLLKRLDDIIDWDEIYNIVKNYMAGISEGTYDNTNALTLLKCLILEQVYNYSDYRLYLELSERKIFRNFINIDSPNDTPRIKAISSFRNDLKTNGLYDMILNEFHEQLLEMKLNILDFSERQNEKISREKENIQENQSDFENKIRHIEDSLDNLYSRKLPGMLSGINGDKAVDVMEKLMNVKIKIDGLAKINSDSTSPEFKKLLDVEKSLINIHGIASNFENKTDKSDILKSPDNENLHLKLYKSFYDALDEGENSADNSSEEHDDKSNNIQGDKLRYADEILSELKTSLENLNEISLSVNDDNAIKELDNKLVSERQNSADNDTGVTLIKEHVPILLNPRMKTEGIFNDENLTEDYELGFRFHQLGLKMGFFNVKLDSQNESTRISTAEFFPNTFWASVKQRSRWIAGICLQNWKAHKWQGNLVAKYFMFRDRKPLFSLFGAFFSNVVFLYFIYSIINNLFDIGPSIVLVSPGSPLWFLMIGVLVFMTSRVFHRFIFTFNWYGFRFAVSSLARLILDTFVNFFAVLRAIKVFKQTKKKVVWDATSHY